MHVTEQDLEVVISALSDAIFMHTEIELGHKANKMDTEARLAHSRVELYSDARRRLRNFMDKVKRGDRKPTITYHPEP